MAESSHSSSPPSADPARDDSRRGFFTKVSSVVVGGVLSLFPLVVGGFTFLDPLRRKKKTPEKHRDSGDGGKEGFVKICALDALSVNGPPQRFPVIADQHDAWNFTPDQPIGSVYIQRVGEEDLRVFNTTCPHAGCSVSFGGSGFDCPCHNSTFDLDGTKATSASGRENPSPRSMDSLDVDPDKLAKGEIWVRFENFYTGCEEKIEKL